MITDPRAAGIVFKAAFEAYVSIDSALREVAPSLPPDELQACKHAVGRAMGAMLGLTEPILKLHPELLPDVWREEDDTK